MKKLGFEDIDELVDIIKELPRAGINKVYTVNESGILYCNGMKLKNYTDEYIDLAICLKKTYEVVVDKVLLASAVMYVANRTMHYVEWEEKIRKYIADKKQVTCTEVLKAIGIDPSHNNKVRMGKLLRTIGCFKRGRAKKGIWLTGNQQS